MNIILAEALITWTPMTYYVATAIIHVIMVYAGFRIMQVDPEHNTVIGAALAGVVIAVVGFIAKDYGLIGNLITGAAIFGILMAITAADAIKALIMSAFVVASFGLIGSFITSRTDLSPKDLGGLTLVVISGELDAEPLQSEKDLYDHVDRKVPGDEDYEE